MFKLHPDYTNRIFGLDLMRFFAIMFVVIQHGSMLNNVKTNFPWIKLINGVEIFFVLSGFLIGGILIKIYQKSDSFTYKSIFNFWIRRWFRTLPNYYFILILNIILFYLGITSSQSKYISWKFFFFLQNFTDYFVGFFWESWSITIEEWFYLFFPIILFICIIILKKFQLPKKQIFLIAISIFFIVPFLFRYLVASNYQVDTFWLHVKIYKVVIFRIDSIAWGLLGAFVYFWYPKTWHKYRIPAFIIGITISYCYLYFTPPHVNSLFSKVYRLYFTSFGCFLMLPFFNNLRKAPIFITKIVTHISLISYSMYLLNLGIISNIISTNFPYSNDAKAWILYICYIICTILFSTILYKYYEKPMMDLRDSNFLKKI